MNTRITPDRVVIMLIQQAVYFTCVAQRPIIIINNNNNNNNNNKLTGVDKHSCDFSCASDHSGKDTHIQNHIDFGSNIKNYLTMGLAHAKKQPHNAKSYMKQCNPVSIHLDVNDNYSLLCS